MTESTGPILVIANPVAGRRARSEIDRSVKLLDVDVHRDGDGGVSKEDYVRRSAELGFWKRHDRVEVPVESVKTIRRLGDL